ncbi:AHH domain-containing protein [Microbulbifer thermotolerans]|uniref:AHH domain-containing protein n=1 Tax=Microbulbifer thermotolerans TaxID=252514 RepID=UPI00224B7178|nr:AHH domain-containing protein [Microbulbifer thermotolerans]MCX2834475.1 AHH domain-containing protein [Microbulbifer thermotolerans]
MARVQQPPAPNAPPKAPNPLELAIYEFEKKAREYHQSLAQKAPKDETPEQTAARRAALQRDLDHLKSERTRIVHMTQIQRQLEEYRERCRNSSPEELAREPHHPTDDLVINMAAAGEPKPSPYHDAHHIIPGKGRWRQDEIAQARTNLHLAGIGIQDPQNGVYLPRDKAHKGHWSAPKAPAHKEIHRYNYETWIFAKFSEPLPTIAFEAALLMVKTQLKTGEHPKEILKPKDPAWNGQ